ncbi:tyrosine-type recombinase/integrase [Paenibacillus polymyxa]|uniref:tyrosine-type recombinase/integrase n=1 Tax=Paenibacillus polymyxa TaxID=1406 RepID=UPI0025B69CF6|nr:site-specific integrase [Paenibacillus polymyxa]
MWDRYRFFQCPSHIESKYNLLVFDSNGSPFIPLTDYYHDQKGMIADSSITNYLNILLPFFYWMDVSSNYQGSIVSWNMPPEAIRVAVSDYLKEKMYCKVRHWSSFELVKQTPKSPDTINRFLAALKSFYKSMIRLDYYSHTNPLIDGHSKKIQTVHGFRNGRPRMPLVAGTEPPIRASYRRQTDSYFKITQNEWLPMIIDDLSLPSQVYHAADKAKLQLRDRIIIRMLFETGARASEVITVTIGDFRARRSIREIATFNKGSNGIRTKFLLFSNDTYILLMKYLKNERIRHDPLGLPYDKLPDDAPLFISNRGTPYSYHAWYVHWKKAVQHSVLKINPHKTRHWYVTNVMRTIYETSSNESERIIRIKEFVRYMRWRSKETLAVYEHFFDEKRQLELINDVHENMLQIEKEIYVNGVSNMKQTHYKIQHKLQEIVIEDSEILGFFEGLE